MIKFYTFRNSSLKMSTITIHYLITIHLTFIYKIHVYINVLGFDKIYKLFIFCLCVVKS